MARLQAYENEHLFAAEKRALSKREQASLAFERRRSKAHQ